MSDTQHPPIRIGNSFTYPFVFTRDDVEKFVSLSGDFNEIHQNAELARRSPIGIGAVPGMLTALIFSRVLGTLFPGHGTIYRSQSLEFLRPVVIERAYEARFLVLSVESSLRSTDSRAAVAHYPRAHIETKVVDSYDGRVCVTGIALVLNQNIEDPRCN